MTPKQEQIIQEHIQMILDREWCNWDNHYRWYGDSTRQQPDMNSATKKFFNTLQTQTERELEKLERMKLPAYERYCKDNNITDKNEVTFVREVFDKRPGFSYRIYKNLLSGVYQCAGELCADVGWLFGLPTYSDNAVKETQGWMVGIHGDGDRALRTIFNAKRNIEANPV
jgi:hypothetical protein